MIGGIFEELFSPGRKHTDDEHNRLALARDDDREEGGPGPVDLDRGVIVIRRSVPAAEADAAARAQAPAAAGRADRGATRPTASVDPGAVVLPGRPPSA
ncbi:DUF6191 domain-containing protein [Yinghuangia seranimata]|uniref:DUF6191 domain-containing protein n=1 Tax=Yinghuangia seranimata TaxID=408067 RepID=UPI00248A9689|nr:DUF6191 domain-containing protein [Yinghuangia seranimata]MDI2126330.1 DUF6191 domain-containing protein [Yinghuangia seranimata]